MNNIKVRNTPDQKLSMQNEDGVLLYDDHRYLRNRSAEDQHPISAITGLVPALNGKLDEEDLPEAVNIALAQAKASGEFNGEKGEKGDSDVIIMQAEGDAVKLTDSSERPFQELKVFLEETQTGVDSVGITVCGKNLLNTNLWRVPTSSSGLTVQYLADEDVFLINGTSTTATMLATRNIYILGEIGESYALSSQLVSGTITVPNGKSAVLYFGNSDTKTGPRANWMPVGLLNGMRVATNPKHYINSAWFYSHEGVVFDNAKVKIQIEKSTAVTDYAPYQAQTAMIDIATQTGGEDLHTYHGVTNILPESGTVACSYVVDTKLYIDKKYNELLAQITALVGGQ